jgi:hypothetical protein
MIVVPSAVSLCPYPCRLAANQVQQRQRKVLKGGFDMRLLLRILATPVVVILSLFVWVCSAILYCSAYLLGLAGSLIGLMALVMFISGSMRNALLLLILAYLISPLGLPMAAAWLLARVQDLRYAIMKAIT